MPRLPGKQIRTIQLHDTTHSPLGLWQLNGSLLDSSGNGRTLTVETGTSRFTQIAPQLEGFLFDGSTALWYNVADAALRLLGDMTFECLWILDEPVASGAFFSHEGSAGETEVNNVLYSWIISTYPTLQWYSEHAAGVDDAATFTIGQPTRGQLAHLAVKRESNIVSQFLNGLPYGPASSALVAPTGGSNGKFRLGAFPTVRTKGVMCSAKLMNTALSADAIKAEYNRTLGPALGMAP